MNKTVLLAAVIFSTALFLHTYSAFALDKPSLDAQYSNYIGLFTGGISNAGVQNSTTTGDASGLALTLDLNTQTSGGENLQTAWGRVNSSAGVDAFVAEVCLDGDATQCWITLLPYGGKNSVQDGHEITEKTAGGGYNASQHLTVAAFSANAGYTTTATNAPSSGTVTFGGQLYSYNPTTNVANQIKDLVLPKGSALHTSLWYCASGTGGQAAGAYKANNVATANPTTFGSLCGGASYFQIGPSVPVTIPVDTAALQQQAAASKQALAQAATSTSPEDSNLPGCGIVWGTKGTINGCAAQLAYGIYNLCATIAGLFGQLFDFFLGYSVSDASYRYPFAITGWKLVRDISNIFFIIIMVWTGFSAVFETSKTSMKNVVPNLIINALLINFSLFATRVVIDISNITARMFYSEMIVCDTVNIDPVTHTCPPANAKTDSYGYPVLSEKIVSSFNPQKIFTPDVLLPPSSNTNANDNGAARFDATTAGTLPTKDINSRDYANYFGIVCLIAAAIMVAVGVMFYKVTFLFLGRVIGLYICMIFSPFAFLSRDIPMLGGIERLRWVDWWKELINYALLAPIFIFFLYIIYSFLSSDFVSQIGLTTTNQSFFSTVMGIVIPMLIIYFMIQAAQKTAEKYAGEIGKSVQGFGEKITGIATGTAFGLATGGAGFLGRNVVGRGLGALSNIKTGKENEVDGKMVKETWGMRFASRSADNWGMRQANKALRGAQTGSWNVGNASVKVGGKDYSVRDGINKGLETFQVKPNNWVAKLGHVGDKAGIGGVVASDKKRAEDRQKEREDNLKFDHLSDDQAKAVWEQYKKTTLEKASTVDAGKKWREDKHIDKDASVKPVAENLAALEKKNAELKAEKADLETEEESLRQQIANGTRPDQIQQYESRLAENQTKQSAKAAEIATNESNKNAETAHLQNVRKDAIERLKKDGAYKDSEAFAEAAKEARDEEEKRLGKYGKIKNGKMLTAAMRAEYAEDLRENSWWLLDGKSRYLPGLIGGAAGAALMVALPGIGSIIGGLLLKNMTDQFVNNRFGDINSKATKKMIDGFKTSQGKGNKEARLTAEIDEINNQITNAMKAHFAGNLPKGTPDEGWNMQQIEEGIAGQTYIIEQKIDELSRKLSAAQDEVEKRTLNIEIKTKRKEIERLNKALERKERAQNELDKVKAANKKDEDNKKEKEEDKK